MDDVGDGSKGHHHHHQHNNSGNIVPLANAVSVQSLSEKMRSGWNRRVAVLEEGTEWMLDKVLGPAPPEPTEDEIVEEEKPPNPAELKRLRAEKRKYKAAKEAYEKEAVVAAKRKAHRLANKLNDQRKGEIDFQQSIRDSEVENKRTILQFTLVQVAGLYAVSQACLLAFFVPQKCPASGPAYNTTSPLFVYTENLPEGHLCVMKENLDWFNCSPFNKDVLLINGVTLMFMLYSQMTFWRREVWCITHLSQDTSSPYDALPDKLKGFEEFAETVATVNKNCYYCACILMCLLATNFGMSAQFLINGDGFYNYSLGGRTISGLLTNTMLVATKVLGYLTYARTAFTNGWAISLFTVIPLSFNRIDDTQKPREVKSVPLHMKEVAEEVAKMGEPPEDFVDPRTLKHVDPDDPVNWEYKRNIFAPPIRAA